MRQFDAAERDVPKCLLCRRRRAQNENAGDHECPKTPPSQRMRDRERERERESERASERERGILKWAGDFWGGWLGGRVGGRAERRRRGRLCHAETVNEVSTTPCRRERRSIKLLSHIFLLPSTTQPSLSPVFLSPSSFSHPFLAFSPPIYI